MQVIQAPDNRLRVSTKPVRKIDNSLRQTIGKMIKLTQTFKDPEGVGLASTQIGQSEQYFIALVDEAEKKVFKAFFNPKILKFSKKTKVMTEGCLSIPNYWGEVKRHTWVNVSYMDEKGKTVKERLSCLTAHIFQHEVDHLNGKLFMDHVLEQKGRLFKVVGKDRAGADVFEEVPL
jgi:peptide deformylase